MNSKKPTKAIIKPKNIKPVMAKPTKKYAPVEKKPVKTSEEVFSEAIKNASGGDPNKANEIVAQIVMNPESISQHKDLYQAYSDLDKRGAFNEMKAQLEAFKHEAQEGGNEEPGEATEYIARKGAKTIPQGDRVNRTFKGGGHLSEEYIEKAHEKPGGSNVGKYKENIDFAGPSGGSPKGSYPIDSEKHAKSALKLAHNAPNPQGIKNAVYRKYPELKPTAQNGAMASSGFTQQGGNQGQAKKQGYLDEVNATMGRDIYEQGGTATKEELMRHLTEKEIHPKEFDILYKRATPEEKKKLDEEKMKEKALHNEALKLLAQKKSQGGQTYEHGAYTQEGMNSMGRKNYGEGGGTTNVSDVDSFVQEPGKNHIGSKYNDGGLTDGPRKPYQLPAHLKPQPIKTGKEESENWEQTMQKRNQELMSDKSIYRPDGTIDNKKLDAKKKELDKKYGTGKPNTEMFGKGGNTDGKMRVNGFETKNPILKPTKKDKDEEPEKAKSGIYIKPKNRGKFTASAKRAGKSMSEAIQSGVHSKNPITKKRAIFAQNMRKIAKNR